MINCNSLKYFKTCVRELIDQTAFVVASVCDRALQVNIK